MEFTNGYIIIPNVAFGFGTKYHMTTDEMMVFGHLQMVKAIGLKNQLITMADVLVAGLDWETSNQSRDKKRVTSALKGLHNKGYITIEFSGKKIGTSVLTITINKKMEQVEAESTVEWRKSPFKWKGHTRIEWHEYNLANNDGQRLMVFVYTKWRGNAEFDYKIADQEWREVLNVSRNTVRKVIEDCESFIKKESGSHYKDENGQIKRETSKYTVKSKVDVKEAEKKSKAINAHDNFAEKVTDLRYKFNDNILKQLNDYGTKIKLDGYKAWLETDCPVLKEAGENKFKMLENAGQGWIKEKLEKELKEKQSRKSSKQHLEMMTDRHIAQIKEFEEKPFEEFVSSYQKREDGGDILEFLD